MGILITRPVQDTLRIAKKIRGRQVYLQPLLCIVEKKGFQEHLEPKSHQALIFTSKHAITIWAKYSSHRQAKVFCVGEVTAQACRAQGFQNIIVAENNARSLLSLIAAEPPQGYIFPSGADVTLDFEEMLGQDRCRRVVVYETRGAKKLRPTVLRALDQGNIHQVILFSNKTALTFKNILPKAYDFEILALSTETLSLFPQNKGRVIRGEEDLIL